MRWFAITPLVAVALSACHGEPGIVCDRERLFVALEDVELDASHDVDPAREGIQIDLVVNSTLDVGVLGILSIVDADGVEEEFGQRSNADADGSFFFGGVTLPPGRIALIVQSFSGCRLVQSTRELFVFDEMGAASCLVTLATTPQVLDLVDDPVLNASADDDLVAADLQTTIRVATGRDDVDITLLLRDVDSGDEQRFEEPAGSDAAAEFFVTLGQGRQAVRAICVWSEFPDLPIPSATLPLFVDTVAPGCALVAPSVAVVAGDDIDADLGNGIQFSLSGQVSGGDARGADTQFEVEGVAFGGSPVDSDGESSAIGTLPNPPPAPQAMTFSAQDQAGNPCSDSVSL